MTEKEQKSPEKETLLEEIGPKTENSPEISIVIPVYNEEGILSTSIAGLHKALEDIDFSYEIIISENGSSDETVSLARTLMERYTTLRLLQSDEPNYGKAMKAGILEARGTIVICDEIDLCDVDFYQRALVELKNDQVDMVVGSKLLDRSKDKRPIFRQLASQGINLLLRIGLNFKGTDTHGLKAFKRERILPVVNKCVVEKDLFASELVIRSERESYGVVEIPVHIEEKRKPSINLVKRVPNVLKNLAKLIWVIRIKNR